MMLRCNPARLCQHLDELGQIGERPGEGLHRLAYSEADKAGRDWAEARMRALGLDVFIDPIGNLLGVRRGLEDGPLVLTGSHLDTVAGGGRFDGALGVLAALEAVERINEAGLATRRPLGVVAFANEEGVRFGQALMGSRVFRGTLALADARALADDQGQTVGACIDALGFGGADDLRRFALHAFVELHIEQGPVLEAEDVPIGVVTGVPGISWVELIVRGQAAHAGGTPTRLRRDAAVAAAEIVRGVRALAEDLGDPLRATVGTLSLHPNLPNVVAGTARLVVDLRHPDDDALAAAEARLEALAHTAAHAERAEVEIRRPARVAPAAFDEEILVAIEQAAGALGHGSRRMLSGGGHDAQIVTACCPAAMLFVPSRDGLSHCPEEFTAPAHIAAGADVLLHTLLHLAGT